MVRGFGLSFLGVVVGVLNLYQVVILIRAIVSWVRPDPKNSFVQFLVVVTEPVLRPLRRLVPPEKLGGIDLSPLFAVLILEFVKNGLIFSFGLRPRFFFF